MDFVALVSGGKDSIYSLCKLIDEGNRLVALIHIYSADPYSDSYMYQTVGTEGATLLGECLDVPMYLFKSKCRAVDVSLDYSECPGDEVEDMYVALATVLESHSFQAVSAGAIASKYQKNRVDNVCRRLGLESLSPLWNRDQLELINEMIEYGVDARIIKVASGMLGKECLNMSLKEIKEYMDKGSRHEMNYCGEGGEFESFVVDCIHFKKRIVVGSCEVLGHPEENNRDGGVYYLILHGLSAVNKFM